MVQEGCDVLIPAWKIPAHLHLHKLSQPTNVLDLLLLQFQECEEATNVETTFKSDTVTTGSLLKQNVIDSDITTFSLIAIVTVWDGGENALIRS